MAKKSSTGPSKSGAPRATPYVLIMAGSAAAIGTALGVLLGRTVLAPAVSTPPAGALPPFVARGL